MVDQQKGWFKIPGIRPNGDRTIQEQSLGLEKGFAEAHGKTVLDLGCAEGAITKQFAEAGALKVVGLELLNSHIAIARKLCKLNPNVEFIQAHLGDFARANPEPEQFDIVLALGVIHKLDDPGVGLRFAALSCKDLLLYRAPANAVAGVVRSKFTSTTCNVPEVMKRFGFVEEALIFGAWGEAVQYWRRAR